MNNPSPEEKAIAPEQTKEKPFIRFMVYIVTYFLRFALAILAYFLCAFVTIIIFDKFSLSPESCVLLFSGIAFVCCAYAIYFFTKKESRKSPRMLFKIIVIPLIVSAMTTFFFAANFTGSPNIMFRLPSDKLDFCIGIEVKKTTPERIKEIEKEIAELEKNYEATHREYEVLYNTYEKTKNIQDKIKLDSVDQKESALFYKILVLENEASRASCFGLTGSYPNSL